MSSKKLKNILCESADNEQLIDEFVDAFEDDIVVNNESEIYDLVDDFDSVTYEIAQFFLYKKKIGVKQLYEIKDIFEPSLFAHIFNAELFQLNSGGFIVDGRNPNLDWKGVTKLEIPSGVQIINEEAFWGLQQIEQVVVPDGVEKIRDRAFANCTSLKSIVLPDSIKSMGKAVFLGDRSLTSIRLPVDLDTIGDSMFYDCKSLSNVAINNGVLLIGYGAFFNCVSLRSLMLPSKLQVIQEDAFDGCTALESLIIPDTVTSIEPCFNRCNSLDKITCNNEKIAREIREILAGWSTEIICNGKVLSESLKEELRVSTPYMLRNDGALLECGAIHPYILMSVKSSLETNIKTLNNHIDFLGWFYNNTLQEEVKTLINEYEETSDSTLLEKLNSLTNDEFCRVRTSNYKIPYGGDNGQIYFRISSDNNFNWFDLIYNVVLQYENLDYITIVKDAQAFKDVKDFDYYKIKGVEINQLPVEDFLTLGGTPIIESINLVEYKKDLKNQAEENKKLKNLLRDLAAKNNLELVDKNLTIHHIDDDIDITLKKYSNNNPDNVLFINTSTVDANAFHQLLHFCKNHYQKGLFSMIKTIKQIFDIPVYSIDSNSNIRQLSFKDAFKKVTEELNENALTEKDNKASAVKSNGVYSVLNDRWIKEPVQSDIPNINREEFDKLFNEWEDRYFELINKMGGIK